MRFIGRPRELETIAGKKTIQPVLIVRDKPTRERVNKAYFYRILEAAELFGTG